MLSTDICFLFTLYCGGTIASVVFFVLSLALGRAEEPQETFFSLRNVKVASSGYKASLDQLQIAQSKHSELDDGWTSRGVNAFESNH